MKEDVKFQYHYSSNEQEEVRKIRNKYVDSNKNKLEQLQELDKSVTKLSTIIAISIGVVSCLIFGLGMSCTTVWKDTSFIAGIVIGIVGIVGMVITYPIYQYVTRKQREKVAPLIIELSDELMKK